jgi:hypothetical protein
MLNDPASYRLPLDIQIPRELQIDIRFWTTPDSPITPIVHALQHPQTRRSKTAEAKKP